MTAYSASLHVTTSPFNTSLALLCPGPYSTRIVRVELFAGYVLFDLYHHSGASISGGSTIIPLPMRAGGPDSTQVVKSGATVSGTTTLLTRTVGGSVSGSAAVFGSTQYEFPISYILAPGSAFRVAFATVNDSTSAFVKVYYEELRLDYSL